MTPSLASKVPAFHNLSTFCANAETGLVGCRFNIAPERIDKDFCLHRSLRLVSFNQVWLATRLPIGLRNNSLLTFPAESEYGDTPLLQGVMNNRARPMIETAPSGSLFRFLVQCPDNSFLLCAASTSASSRPERMAMVPALVFTDLVNLKYGQEPGAACLRSALQCSTESSITGITGYSVAGPRHV